ncbi:hypothetical protein RJ641_013286 [Dillenia turbinata]|uniref:Uncharacterized protein n=1 Tax=Dillenia turbinata TaxID=194707 RepID=A0AAN8WCE6_9MAGN
MERSPILLRQIVTSMFISADNSLITLAERYKLLQFIRCLLVSFFLLFLRVLPSFFPSLNSAHFSKSSKLYHFAPALKSTGSAATLSDGRGADSGIARALSQLLSIVHEIPVSSRKYDVVRSLAEKIIDDNNEEGFDSLREVNRTVLSVAFDRTLALLEELLTELERDKVEDVTGEFRLNRVLKAVRSLGDRFGKGREEVNSNWASGEKLAAELLWLAQKLTACGNMDEAVVRWAAASNLAWLSLFAEPRLQCSLVKLSAFLIKQAKEMGEDEADDEIKKALLRKTKMNLLMSWLPLLCCASNGTDVPVLSTSERVELEKVLEDIIGVLDHEEEQEKVLSLWLHHFTYCPSSDWPNLHKSYTKWCNASRKHLVLQ